MKFTLSWLRAHLETDASLDQITTTLSTIGLEVEGVEDRAAALASFRIAEVVEAAQHPNADRLRALKVNTGEGPLLSVVCGAPNARAGMRGVVALPGAFIPGTGITLKKGEIRGVASEAMMLSAREMGLGDDHSGIVDLPSDAPVGARYVDYANLSDPVIEIAVTPNRGDALSVHGIARDLAAAGLGRLRPLPTPSITPAYPSPLTWVIEDPRACTHVLGRAIRGLRNGRSPQWLQDWLTAIGQRPINALVDVTNLYTFGMGRPLHVFDVAKVQGTTLTMRMSRPGETLAALNGKTYALGEEDGIIADAAGPEALGGIIGGAPTGCDEGTTECFIECAIFDPVRIALSGRRHAVNTDARARFERGVDQDLPRRALEMATATMIELCGGEASEISEAGTPPAWQRRATLRFARLAELGGAAVLPDDVVAILERLGFVAGHRDAEAVTLAVPPWRNDVAQVAGGNAGATLDPRGGILTQPADLAPDRAAAGAAGCAVIEPEADLIEEVLRIRGLDAIAPRSLPTASPVPAPALSPRQARQGLARRVMAARGMLDCVTYGFLDHATAALFGDTPNSLRVENPISADLDQMRPTPVASLLQAASRNAARGYPAVALCEIGGAYRHAGPDGQLTLACGIRTGETPRHWAAPARALDAFDAKADALAVLAALGVPMAALSATPDAPGFYHPGRSGVLRQGPKTVLAHFGEVHPRIAAALDLGGPAIAFEVFLDAIPDPKRRRKSAPDLAPFQPVRRDFAFLVDAVTPVDAVLRAARGADRALITDVALFDRYAGEKLPEGKISLAIDVTLQPREATLTDAGIEAVAQKIIAAVVKATGATLRA